MTMEKMEDISSSSNEHEDDEKKINYRGVRALPFIIGNEAFEKLGTVGTMANLLVYLTSVFNMKSITATNIINIFNGTINFATLLGAFFADTYFGRYNILAFASVASFLGMVVLTLTAAIPKLHPPHCVPNSGVECLGPTPGQMAFLVTGFAFLVIGGGGIRPCNLAFGADQFNPNSESGKRAISSFFNWYYFTFTFAVMVSVTIIVYIQADKSWAWGLAIPAFMMFLSCFVFFIGTRIYVKVKPQGSPLLGCVCVVVAAINKRRMKLPSNPQMELFNYIPKGSINSKLGHTYQLRFLEKAAIYTPKDQINPDGSPASPWRLCSMQQVEEVKCVVKLLPVWISGIIYYIATVQQQNYSVFQALQMNRQLGATNFRVPAASYGVFTMISLTIWIPIYDRIIVPMIRKQTGKEGGITVLQKMGIGTFLSVITMILSGIVEQRRRVSSSIGVDPARGAISSLSGMWLIPQLALMGVSEAFMLVGELELMYKQFPENMRSVAGAILFVGLAFSSYLSSLLISIVHRMTEGDGDWLPQDLNKGRLDYFYYLVAALEALNLGYFLVCASWYKYKESTSTSSDQDSEKP